MANEVIIEEYARPTLRSDNNVAMPVPGPLTATQTLNIAAQSASFQATTATLRIQSKGTGFWYQVGTTSVAATAATSPARWLPADQFRDISIVPGMDVRLSTAA